jgi:hypothetical protein
VAIGNTIGEYIGNLHAQNPLGTLKRNMLGTEGKKKKILLLLLLPKPKI